MEGLILNKSSKSTIILALFFAFYIVSAIAYEFTPDTAKISTVAIYLLFMSGGIYIFKKSINFSLYTVCILLLGLDIFIMMFPMVFSENPNLSNIASNVGYAYFTCMTLCLVVYMFIYHNPKYIAWIVFACIVGACILIIRVIDGYGGIDDMLEFATNDNYQHRIGTGIINENILGLHLSNAALCTLILMVLTKKLKIVIRFFLVTLLIAFVAMALLTGSKKAIIYIIVGIFMTAALIPNENSSIKKIVVVTVSLFFILLLIWSIYNLDVFSTIRLRIDEMFITFSNGETSQSDRTRMRFISEGMDAFWNSPFLGQGTGYSYKLFDTYSHNNFVELLMSYGIVGFLLYYTPYCILIPKLYRKTKENDTYAVYFFVYVLLQLFMGFALVCYYDRVMQLIVSAAWGYCDSKKTEMVLNED